MRREIPLLIAAAVAAVPIFFFTRAFAAWNRHTHSTTAVYWYNQGLEQQRHGDLSHATESFRSAVVNDRGQSRYGLALAGTLTSLDRGAEARQVLLRLRDAAPEDPGINLELARLAVKETRPSDALRYYHIALDGLWAGDGGAPQTARRAEVRIELTDFLLRHNQRDQAEAELLALTFDLPPNAAAQNRAGQLFLRAGDPSHAREAFRRALQADRTNKEARLGLDQSNLELTPEHQ